MNKFIKELKGMGLDWTSFILGAVFTSFLNRLETIFFVEISLYVWLFILAIIVIRKVKK